MDDWRPDRPHGWRKLLDLAVCQAAHERRRVWRLCLLLAGLQAISTVALIVLAVMLLRATP
jgi:hypothetical protein